MTTQKIEIMNPEILDSYRRTLVFNNSLLIREFSERYDFRVGEKMRKMRLQGIPEEKVLAYEKRAMRNKSQKEQLYRKRLENSVEGSVQRYHNNIMAFLMGTEPE